MNELLGLYGYGKVDSRDTLGLSLHRFTTAHSSPPPHPPPTATLNTSSSSPLPPNSQSPSRQPPHSSPPLSASHSPQHQHASSDHEHEGDSLDSDDMPVSGQLEHGFRSVSPSKTDQGSGSSRGSTPKSDSGGVVVGGGVGGSGLVLCSWCGRVCTSGGQRGGSAFQLPTTGGDRHFCSEVCFTQCRRASFKKSKVCDWCRHVRPTVTYVDFTDGDHQLQFCSDKCLNQYKMQIFCRETEAHLQMHPHLNDLKPASNSGLITPDLWLRDCGGAGGQSNEVDSLPEGEVKVDSPQSPPAPATPPPPSPDPAEPVNLTTTQSSARSEPRASPSLTRGSPVTVRQVLSRSAETKSPGPLPHTPRYGRPRLRDRREGIRELGRPRTVRASLQLARGLHSDADKTDEPLRMPTIRVRQLESQQQQDMTPGERELASSNEVGAENNRAASPHPSVQPPSLPLGGLGSLLPMVGGAQLLLPHMLPHDLPRTPLLPHLLLQRPELLRPPPLRHPLLHGPPAPAPPTPAPPTSLPPPPPGPPKTPGSLLPPVTVLLPCPLPIPIPIPIPVPIPIPFIPRNDTPEARQPPQKEMSGRQRTTPRKEACRTGSVINGPMAAATSSGPAPQPCPIPVAPPPPPTSSSSSDGERSTHPRPDRERRSILRYTSDVYEINGMFVPRDSTWDSPEPLHLRRALVGDTSQESTYSHHHEFDSRDISRSPSPDLGEDNKDALANLTKKREEETSTVKRLLGDDDEEEEESKSVEVSETESSPASTATTTTKATRKRHTAGDHPQPLPKKKHLLV
ncbi:hypothetical protein OTU49_016749 [Cherax quadricarinatus]|uniref:Sine oculis-binding protein homolog n=2 Tax=Cherax quadricarinatus TaxID=27406 RepID=A0AAW0XRZ9_CHEQU